MHNFSNLLANSGLVLVDKPVGFTSHDIVNKLRNIYGTKKVGHAGTLDPFATGLLVLGVGRATKLLNYLTLARKTYEADIVLGISTNTDDITGEILSKSSSKAAMLTESLVGGYLNEFVGDIRQVPSKVSAKRVNGKKAYELERQGKAFHLDSVPVNIGEITSTNFKINENGLALISVKIECSSGTYIRALARDLGEKIGVGGCVSKLNRTKVGPFNLTEAVSLASLAVNKSFNLSLNGLVEFLFPRININESEVMDVRNGRKINSKCPGERYAVFSPTGNAIAILNEINGEVATDLVIYPANFS